MSDGEAAVFKSLIESMLQYDPGKRPLTTELLRHARFTTEDFSRERHAAPPRRNYVVVRGGRWDTSSPYGTASLPGSPVMELPR